MAKRKKRRVVKEAGESRGLTPQEQAMIQKLPTSAQRHVMNLVTSMRKRGHQYSVGKGIQELSQTFPELAQYVPQAPPQAIMQQGQPSQQQKPAVPAPPQALMQQGGPMAPIQPQQKQTPFTPGQQAASQAPQVRKSQWAKPEDTQTDMSALQQTAQQVQQFEQEEPWQKKARNRKKLQQQRVNPTGQTMYPEARTIKTKTQLKEAVQKIVLREQRVALAKKILTEQIHIQKEARKTALHLLNEGPFSNVWADIKSAGTAAMDRFRGGGDMDGQTGATDRDQKIREIVNGISRLVAKAYQQKQKWNAQILKSSELMNQYHDAALKAFNAYQKYSKALGPAGIEVNRQVDEVIESLRRDLMSEVSQIEAMFKSLKDEDVSLDQMLQQHKDEARERMERDADREARMKSSFGRTKDMMPSSVRMHQLKTKTTPTDEKDLPGQEEKEAAMRVAATDKAAAADYDRKSKALVRQILRTEDKAEKRALTDQLMALVKQMKGLGLTR